MSLNVTIDSHDPEITYIGQWDPPYYSPKDYEGSHMLGYAPATAELDFSGIAVYYWSPLWPYLVNVSVTLDGGEPTFVDLTDYAHLNDGEHTETIQSGIQWSATGLADSPHSLVIGAPEGAVYVVVDAITYTTDDTAGAPASSTDGSGSSATSGPDPAMTPSSTDVADPASAILSSDTPTLSPSSSPQTDIASSGLSHQAAVAVGSAIAVLLFLAFLALCFYLYRLMRRRESPSRGLEASAAYPFPHQSWSKGDRPGLYGPRAPSVSKSTAPSVLHTPSMIKSASTVPSMRRVPTAPSVQRIPTAESLARVSTADDMLRTVPIGTSALRPDSMAQSTVPSMLRSPARTWTQGTPSMGGRTPMSVTMGLALTTPEEGFTTATPGQ